MDDSFDVLLDVSAASIALSPSSSGASTLTAMDLITRALKMLGVIAGTETPADDQATDALADLNDLLDSWRTERLTIPGESRALYPLVANTATYTIGPGGAFNQGWPLQSITREPIWSTPSTASRWKSR